jgi:putative oxidoreductase
MSLRACTGITSTARSRVVDFEEDIMAEEAKRAWQGRGIAALRMMVGIVFLAHGCQKLFVYHFSGVAAMLGSFGIPLPHLSAVVVTLVEALGGLALFLGLATRWAALLLAIDMAVAVFGVHLKNGFFLPTGFEYALTLLVANAALMMAGPGTCALDNLICKKKPEPPPAFSEPRPQGSGPAA